MWNKDAPWMLSAADIKKDALFFVPAGIIFGAIQIAGYHDFNKAEWGSTLLQEHISFNSLMLITVILWIMKALIQWLSSKMEMARAKVLVEHLSKRAIAYASVPASAIVGFGVAAAIDGAYYYACSFMILSLYFISLAEIAANPLFGPGQSRTYFAAFGIIIAMPFAAHLLV